MATYRDYAAHQKRKKTRKYRARAIVLVLVLLLLFAISFGISLIIKSFTNDEKPVKPSVGSSTNLDIDNSITTMPDVTIPTDPSSADAVLAEKNSWNTLSSVPGYLYSDFYSPDSRLYSLPVNGKAASSYFSSCMFIGDSISQGIASMSYLKDEVLSGTGVQVCAYLSTTPKSFLDNATAKNPWGEYVAIWDDIVSRPIPRNIYILLGTNAIVSMNDEAVLVYYGKLLDQLQAYYAPYGTTIYVQTITPVTAATAAARANMNNDRIRNLNNSIAQLAVTRGMLVVDLHEVFEDENGNLDEEYSAGDGYHLNNDGYAVWLEYLQYHTAYSPLTEYEIQPDAGLTAATISAQELYTLGTSGTIGSSTIGSSTIGSSTIGGS